MSTETGTPPSPNLKDWWKAAFESDIYRTLIPAERGPDILDTEMRTLPTWLNLQPGQTLLDLACGDGRLSVPMASAGHQVVGIDQSQKLLGLARRRLPETQGRLELINGDMRAFHLPKPADAAVCVFFSFGMFLDERDHLKTLQATAAALKPNGRLYLEVFNPFYFIWPAEQIANSGDTVIIYQTVMDHAKGRVNSQVHYAQNGKPPQTVTLSWRAYPLWEITRLLDAAGFDVVTICGGMASPEEFTPMTHNTLGIVAERRPVPSGDAADPTRARGERPGLRPPQR